MGKVYKFSWTTLYVAQKVAYPFIEKVPSGFLNFDTANYYIVALSSRSSLGPYHLGER
jgi:hypothetical protein